MCLAKGTNENSNGLLREFYHKHMDLSKTNEKEVQDVLKLLNNRPRKYINYKTPQELFDEFYVNVALDLTNYRFENGWHMTGDRHVTSDSLIA